MVYQLTQPVLYTIDIYTSNIARKLEIQPAAAASNARIGCSISIYVCSVHLNLHHSTSSSTSYTSISRTHTVYLCKIGDAIEVKNYFSLPFI